MSHFLAFVIVGRDGRDIARRVDELLDPYFGTELPDGSPNPRYKFDGCAIGGRFDGQIHGAEPMYNLTPAEFQRRYGLDVIRESDNVRAAAEVPADLIPYAVVTPRGEWIDCEGKRRGAWGEQVRRLLDEHADQLVVAVDCHC